jgi:anti-sigma factor RsiW
MTCDDLQEDLSASLDGELDAARERAIDVHLAACERCRATRAAWSGQSVRLRDAGRRTPPPPPWEVLASRIDGAADRASLGGADRTRLGAAFQNGAHAELAASRSGTAAFSPPRAVAARIGFRLVACSAAALLFLGVIGVFVLRPARPVSARAELDAMLPAIVRQLVDAGSRPDLSALGAVTPVSRDRFATLRADAGFSPVAPAGLPGGYVFDEGWVIDSKICRMVCARYKKDGRVLAVLQAGSNGVPICTLANPQCCKIAGLLCRRSRIDRVDIVQTTRGRLALTVVANAGETDIEAVMATLSADAALREN